MNASCYQISHSYSCKIEYMKCNLHLMSGIPSIYLFFYCLFIFLFIFFFYEKNKFGYQFKIVAVVIGVAISIIAIGWLCLFIYYNSCGRPYAIMNEKTSTSAIFRKDKFIQTSENDDGSKFSNIQSRAFTESDKEKNSQNISVDCTSLGTTQKRVKDATGTDVISNVAAMAASETDDNEREMKSASQETFDYPMSIVTRPRRKDLITQKLELLNDLPLPVMKEIWKEDTPHPHPMPPTVSGILEVRNFTEQPHTNPMNCL
ncbi:unnamed protein product [Thelazia callipaeda]|uniref:Pecanex-like protein n=1 Tax=Thelazia callipaeda TaxID=103827 RepID=A0A0N5CVU3_THECL|nr:unnamed protein product [Thelazia callipaeda]